jgi:hypothetical protein
MRMSTTQLLNTSCLTGIFYVISYSLIFSRYSVASISIRPAFQAQVTACGEPIVMTMQLKLQYVRIYVQNMFHKKNLKYKQPL